MAQSDCASVHVQAIGLDVQLAIARDDLGGESLVQLHEIEVGQPQRELLLQGA